MKMTMGNETRDASLSLLRLLLPPPIGGGGGGGEKSGGKERDSRRFFKDSSICFWRPPPLLPPPFLCLRFFIEWIHPHFKLIRSYSAEASGKILDSNQNWFFKRIFDNSFNENKDVTINNLRHLYQFNQGLWYPHLHTITSAFSFAFFLDSSFISSWFALCSCHSNSGRFDSSASGCIDPPATSTLLVRNVWF